MASKFIPNPHLDAELMAQGAFAGAMRAQAEVVRAAANQIGRDIKAPWLPREGEPTFVVAQRGPEVGVVNTDHLGHLMEWGWVQSGPRAPLRRAARAAGFIVK